VSDDRHQTSECLDAETLAAFMDGRLEPRERAAVEAHLADCEDCYEVWMEGRANRDQPDHPKKVPSSRRRGLVWMGSAGAVAASLLLLVWTRPDVVPGLAERQTQSALETLVAEVDTQYVSLGRFEGFRPGIPAGPTRGDTVVGLNDAAHEAALRVLRTAAQRESPAAYSARGKASVIVGRLDEGVEHLRRAARLEPDSPRIQSDLSAALLALWQRDQEGLLASEALSAAQNALAVSSDLPEALFNRAAALEALALVEGAVGAWERYLVVDSASPWAEEARRRLGHLRRQTSNIAPETLMAEARQRAATEPWLIHDHLETVVFPRWVSTRSDVVVEEGLPFAIALADADRDRAAVTTLRVAHAWSGRPAGLCVRDYVEAHQEAQSAFEAGDFSAAGSAAGRARRAATCAGVPPYEVDLIDHLVSFSVSGTTDLVRLSALQQASERAQYLTVAARCRILQAIGMHQALRFDESVALYQYAIVLADRAGRAGLRASARAKLASVYFALGEDVISWRLFVEAFSDLPHRVSHLHRFQVLAVAMVAANSAGLSGAELALAEELLRQTAGWKDPSAQIHAELRRATLLAPNDPKGAARDLASARRAISMITDASLRASHEAEADLVDGVLATSVDPRRAIASLTSGIEALENLHNPYRTATLLLGRGQAFAALGQTDNARADWRRAIDSIERDRAQLKDSALRVSRLDELWDLYEALVDSLRSSPTDALAALEAGRARELRGDGNEARSIERLESIQNRLSADVQILVYATLKNRILIWHIEPKRGTRLFEQPVGRAALSDLAHRFLADRQPQSAAASITLARLLLPPSVDLSKDTTLVIIPDGPLASLPFGALPRGVSDEVLIDRTTVVLAPSLAVLDRMSRLPVHGSEALLISSPDARPVEGLPALPGATREVGDISRFYGPTARVLEGEDATLANLAAAVPDANVIHFAGHAVAEPAVPSRSRILIAPATEGAALTPTDVERLRIRPGTLVVLSACSTAVGRVYNGEGALSLARPFLTAGAGGVVGALWPALDRDAQRLMVLFHEYLTSRQLHPSVALAHAQRTLRKEQPGGRSWQTFVYIGGIPMEDS